VPPDARWQTLWDEYMAASIAGYLRSPVPAPMLARGASPVAAAAARAPASAAGAADAASAGAPDPGWRMVVLVGTDHVRGRVGVPDRVTRRTGASTFTMVPLSVPWAESGLPAIERPLGANEGEWLLYTQPLIDDPTGARPDAAHGQQAQPTARLADPRGPKPRLSVDALRLNQRGTIYEL
jgi:hypothetical protein